jgi:hypothetical protein
MLKITVAISVLGKTQFLKLRAVFVLFKINHELSVMYTWI